MKEKKVEDLTIYGKIFKENAILNKNALDFITKYAKGVFVRFPNNKFQIVDVSKLKLVEEIIYLLMIFGNNFSLVWNENVLNTKTPITFAEGDEIQIILENGFRLIELTNEYNIIPIIIKFDENIKNLKTIFRKKYGFINEIFLNGVLLCEDEIVPKCERLLYTHHKNNFSSPFQIYIKTLVGRTIPLEIDSFSDTIEEIKKKIEEKEDIPFNQIGLIFGGKKLENIYKCGFYGIINKSSIHLVVRLRGGGDGPLGKSFVDISKENTGKAIEFSHEAPDWRICCKGLNLEGICKNKDCIAFNKWVIIKKGIGTYDLIYDAQENICPICRKLVDVKKCGFSSCFYNYVGVQIEKGIPPKKIMSLKEKEVGDNYLIFDPKEAGICSWLSFKICTKEKQFFGSANENFCGVCWKEVKNEEKMKCQHILHDKCKQILEKFDIKCALCYF